MTVPSEAKKGSRADMGLDSDLGLTGWLCLLLCLPRLACLPLDLPRVSLQPLPAASLLCVERETKLEAHASWEYVVQRVGKVISHCF